MMGDYPKRGGGVGGILMAVLGIRILAAKNGMIKGIVAHHAGDGNKAVPQSQACELPGRIVSNCSAWSHICSMAGCCMAQLGKSINPLGLINSTKIRSTINDLAIMRILSNSGSVNQ